MKTSHSICLLILAACYAAGQEPCKTESCKTSTILESHVGITNRDPDACSTDRRDVHLTDFGSWKKMLTEAPAPEMPALAATLVNHAPVAQQEQAIVWVVQAALEINPAAVTLVVGAIARVVPDMAAVAAAAAAAKQPGEAEVISRAATSVAPAMAGSIVGALCKAAPESYESVAIIASQQPPGEEREILRSVAAAQPALGPPLDFELAKYERAIPPVALILSPIPLAPTNAAMNGAGALTQPLAATSSPSPKPKDDHADNGGNGWHGGRNYARP
jgi:hypothetical protein